MFGGGRGREVESEFFFLHYFPFFPLLSFLLHHLLLPFLPPLVSTGDQGKTSAGKRKKHEKSPSPYRKVDDRIEHGGKQQLEREARERLGHEERRDLVQAPACLPPQQRLLRVHDRAGVGRGLQDRAEHDEPERGDAVKDAGRGVGVGGVGGAEAEVGGSEQDAEKEVLRELDACR